MFSHRRSSTDLSTQLTASLAIDDADMADMTAEQHDEGPPALEPDNMGTAIASGGKRKHTDDEGGMSEWAMKELRQGAPRADNSDKEINDMGNDYRGGKVFVTHSRNLEAARFDASLVPLSLAKFGAVDDSKEWKCYEDRMDGLDNSKHDVMFLYTQSEKAASKLKIYLEKANGTVTIAKVTVTIKPLDG